MDGPAFVTQCPIIPGNAFRSVDYIHMDECDKAQVLMLTCRYNFTVPDQAGTYWYHSHLSTQYCDGLR